MLKPTDKACFGQVSELPGGESRLIQKALGVKMTLVYGEVLTENGEHTGTLPGQVLGNGKRLHGIVA